MEKKLLVSVIVPVYNVEKYVEKCLKSLCAQSYEQLEIIVVDDGSTDKSGGICDKMMAQDARIKVYHKKNGGLSSARNYGLNKAKGEYVCLVDSDDWVKKDFVRVMLDAAVRNDTDIVACGYNGGDAKAELMTGKSATIKLLTGQENVDIVAWNKIYKKGLFELVRYPEGENYEDTLTTYKILSKAKRVAYVAEKLYVYRERVGSITKSDKKEIRLLVRERAAREAIGYFPYDKDLKAAAQIAFLTAKLAFVDAAVAGRIDKRYGRTAQAWIKQNAKRYEKNQFLTGKLGVYIALISHGNGILYRLFRKIRHE